MATKSDIVKKLIEKHPSLNKRIIVAIINSFFAILADTLKIHNKIEFRGFASFSVRSYNIKAIESAVHSKFTKNKYFKVYFRSSKSLSNLVNE